MDTAHICAPHTVVPGDPSPHSSHLLMYLQAHAPSMATQEAWDLEFASRSQSRGDRNAAGPVSTARAQLQGDLSGAEWAGPGAARR